jgi:hypothetical protein
MSTLTRWLFAKYCSPKRQVTEGAARTLIKSSLSALLDVSWASTEICAVTYKLGSFHRTYC